MGKTIGIIIAIVVLAAAAGAGGFYGGTAYAAYNVQKAANVRAAFLNGRGGAVTSPTTGAAAGAAGGGVSGTVKSITGDTIQVSSALSVTAVTISSATTIMKSETATTSDLQVGQQVTVRGQRDAAGNVTATSIQVVPAGATAGGNGGPSAGPTATPVQ